MFGDTRPIAAQTGQRLAGAAPVALAWLAQALPPELEHLVVQSRGRDLRGVGERGALRRRRALVEVVIVRRLLAPGRHGHFLLVSPPIAVVAGASPRTAGRGKIKSRSRGMAARELWHDNF
jgi:hypothetical protein